MEPCLDQKPKTPCIIIIIIVIIIFFFRRKLGGRFLLEVENLKFVYVDQTTSSFFLYFIDIYISLQIRVTITIEITFADKKKEKLDKLT